MLGKLFKYDLKNILKFISVFYIITLVLSVLTRFFINQSSPLIVFIIGKILSGTLISMFASIIINCFMRLLLKTFTQGVYADESYLTHTLPVTKSEIYFSKALTAITVLLTSFGVIIISTFIAYYTDARWQTVKQIIFFGNTKTVILLAVIVLFLEFINLIQCSFTGIILGHRQNSGKAIMSVIFSIAAITISQIIVLLILAIISIFNDELRSLFTSNANITTSVFYIIIPIYILLICGCAAINIKLLKKGVDVE